MSNASDYESARKRIINKTTRQGRMRREEIRNRDERNIRRYGECPIKFKDFVSERVNESEDSSLLEKWSKCSSTLYVLKSSINALIDVAERNESRLSSEGQVNFMLKSLRKYLNQANG